MPAVIIGGLLYRIPTDDWQRIAAQDKDFRLIAGALLVALAAMSTAQVRWCVLVRAQDIALSMVEAFRLGAIGFLLSFVSVGSVGGDVFKAAFLARRRPGRRVAAVASVFVDRGAGLYGLLLLVAVGLAMVDAGDLQTESAVIDLPTIRVLTYGLIAIGTVVLAVLIFGGRGVDRLIAVGSRLPLVGPVVAKIGPPLRTFHTHPAAFFAAVGLSVVVQALLTISLLLIARGLYEDPPSAAEHFVIVPIGMLVSALPLTPAGVGVLEVAIETMYEVFQGPSAVASGTLVALIFELVKLIVAAIGIAFYWTAPPEVLESMEA